MHLIPHSEETKKRISDKLKGVTPWNKGKKQLSITGEKHYLWSGNMVGYRALHTWINKNLGKASKCINGHIAKRYCWANKSGEYKRILSDWKEVCTSCNLRDGIKIHPRFEEGGVSYARSRI